MTNAEKALEDMPPFDHHERDFWRWCCGNYETIRRALLKAHAIDSGELIKYVGPTCDYEPLQYGEVTGWNECLERLKEIGGGDE